LTLFKKSLYLIIYYIAVATFTALSFSTILTSYKNTQFLQDGLTQNSLYFSIQENSNSGVSVGQVIEALEQHSNSFLIYKDLGNHYAKSIYLNQYSFPLKTLGEQPIDSIQPGQIILDQSLLNNAIIKDGTPQFLYNGKHYVILESFTWINKYINIDSRFFVALTQEESAIGNYSIDGVTQSNLKTALDQLSKNNPISYSIHSATQSFQERFQLVLQDQSFVMIIFAVALLLMTLSIFGTTISWIQSRKDELRIRHLVGATSTNLRMWLLKEYWILLSFSFVIGVFIAWLIVRWGMFSAIIQEVTLMGIFISFIFCSVLGTLTALLSTYRKFYNNWRNTKEEVLLP